MINSSGSSRSSEPLSTFGKAGASAAFTAHISREERLTRFFDFNGILREYSIAGNPVFEKQLSYTTHDLDESPTSHGSFQPGCSKGAELCDSEDQTSQIESYAGRTIVVSPGEIA